MQDRGAVSKKIYLVLHEVEVNARCSPKTKQQPLHWSHPYSWFVCVQPTMYTHLNVVVVSLCGILGPECRRFVCVCMKDLLSTVIFNPI